MKWEDRWALWDERENPWPLIRGITKWLFLIVGFGTAVGLGLQIVCAPARYASRVAAVVAEELDPRELLRKYQWFKDAHAALGAKLATIHLYEVRRTRLEHQYGPAARWPRDVREEWSLQESELSGVVASYNLLAADYNAQMAKLNWRFTNRGQLPAGATETLPRDYAPYQEAP